jgi:hypothetical protein
MVLVVVMVVQQDHRHVLERRIFFASIWLIGKKGMQEVFS